MQAALQNFYRARLPEAAITDFESITDGWETEVYAFTLTYQGASQRRILRVYPGADAAHKASHEFTVMQQLDQVGYPVPQVYELSLDPQWQPFITMQFIEGQSASSLLTSENAAEKLDLFCRLLVELHQLDLQPFLPDDVTMQDVVDPMWFVQRIRTRLASLHASPVAAALHPLLAWLDQHVVPSPRLSLLHSDFHGNNILITPAGQPYVIDWGTSLIGDYRFDLAWTLLLASTYGQPAMYAVLLEKYAAMQGQSISDMAYFEILAVLRRLLDLLVALHSGAASHGMRPETVNIMRQQRSHYEAVYGWVIDRTGLRLPQVEQVLAKLGG